MIYYFGVNVTLDKEGKKSMHSVLNGQVHTKIHAAMHKYCYKLIFLQISKYCRGKGG